MDLTDYPFAIEFGDDLGNAEGSTQVVESLLADGEIESTDRRTNRTIVLTVQIEGSDLAVLAQSEAQLIGECRRERNTLSVDPGDGFGAVTVFDTFEAEPRRIYDEAFEQSGYRRWELTIRALPYGRSATLTTETAEGIPSVGTLVNAADSLTGWSTPLAQVPGSTSNTYVTASPQPASMLALDTATKVEGTASVAAKAYRVDEGRSEGILPSGPSRVVRTSLTLTQAITITAGSYLSFAVKLDNTFGVQQPASPGYYPAYKDGGTLDSFTITTASSSRTYTEQAKVPYEDPNLLRNGVVQALPGGWTRYTFRVAEPTRR